MLHKELSKVAIVLFNLGGPDRPEAIRRFLLNLFRDPAILRIPNPVRTVLSRVIVGSRSQPARENYAQLNGRSPLLEVTRGQAAALEAALPELQLRCFIAMRYWHPLSDATTRAVRAWGANQIVLLPLYPQYSTTTTKSSLAAWRKSAARTGLVAETRAICCYPTAVGYVGALASLIRDSYVRVRSSVPQDAKVRILFSAHGLPESIVRGGDPYQWQVEQTARAVMEAWGEEEVDWRICYQSRATPQRWLEPSTSEQIEQAARDCVALLVVPIAFVSEHSETLVELDIEYSRLAEKSGVPGYFRVPAAGVHSAFIASLAQLVRGTLAQTPGLYSQAGGRICPAMHKHCPWCSGLAATIRAGMR